MPVFCVIIKNALEFNEVCPPSHALVWGAAMPYLFSWTLYQGTVLMSMMNWTGLVVNGFVAFLLPLVLALETLSLRGQQSAKKSVKTSDHHPHHPQLHHLHQAIEEAPQAHEASGTVEEGDDSRLVQAHLHHTRVVFCDTVQPLPATLEVHRREIILFMMLSFGAIIALTIIEDIISGIIAVDPNERRK